MGYILDNHVLSINTANTNSTDNKPLFSKMTFLGSRNVSSATFVKSLRLTIVMCFWH